MVLAGDVNTMSNMEQGLKMKSKNEWGMAKEDIKWLLLKLQNYRKENAPYNLSSISPNARETDMLIDLIKRELEKLKNG